MEGRHNIVLQALEQAGVEIPSGVDSLQDLSPSALVGMCRGALACIEGVLLAASPPFPVSMAERFRICSDLSCSVKNIGFQGDLSFHQFLYPSEESSYKVLHFLVDKLSKSSGGAAAGRMGCSSRSFNESTLKKFAIAREACPHLPEDEEQKTDIGTSGVVGAEDFTTAPSHPLYRASMKASLGKKTPPLMGHQAKSKSFPIPSVVDLNARNAVTSTAGLLSHLALEAQSVEPREMGDVRTQDLNISGHLNVESRPLSLEAASNKEKYAILKERIKQGESGRKEQDGQIVSSNSDGLMDLDQGELSMLEKKLAAILLDNSKLAQEIMEFKKGISEVDIHYEASSKQLELLKKKRDSIRIASEIALDSTQTEESKLLQLETAVKESQQRLADSKNQWESVSAELESKKCSLELLFLAESEELESKLQELKNVQQKITDTTMKLKQRDQQLIEITAELEKGTKGPTRSTYVQRITDLIKNSKKQDNDIARILADTRNLQRESNANQGRLKRTHAVVDDLIFRDAKKDPVCRQAYRLLTSIHEDFSDCYGKVFSMDKVCREIAELQATIETLENRPVDLKKVQADFDALVDENLSLEKSIQAARIHGNDRRA